jgi:hypothetical protein
MRKLAMLLLMAGFPLAALAQAHDQGTSDEFAYFTYKEEAGDVTFLVDAFSAFFAEGQPYVPLHVGVANFKGAPLHLTLESFSLLDAKGNREDPASLTEIQRDYTRLSQDIQLMLERPMNVGQLFTTLQQISAAFYPQTAGRLATQAVEIPAGTWWQDSIYFPMPQAGLSGVMSMELRDKRLSQPIVVKFDVPLKKPSSKDKKKSSD